MPDAFAVRVATPADDAAVNELLAASYPALMRGSYDAVLLAAALPLMTQANPTLLSSGTYYLAETADGAVAGCGGWTRERPGSGEVVSSLAHIRHFATHPDWVGRGVGRAIYTECAAAARRAGVRRFECYASINAEGFYMALGFKSVRGMSVPMGPRLEFPSILMMRSI